MAKVCMQNVCQFQIDYDAAVCTKMIYLEMQLY